MTSPGLAPLMLVARSRSVDGVFREGGGTDDGPRTTQEEGNVVLTRGRIRCRGKDHALVLAHPAESPRKVPGHFHERCRSFGYTQCEGVWSELGPICRQSVSHAARFSGCDRWSRKHASVAICVVEKVTNTKSPVSVAYLYATAFFLNPAALLTGVAYSRRKSLSIFKKNRQGEEGLVQSTDVPPRKIEISDRGHSGTGGRRMLLACEEIRSRSRVSAAMVSASLPISRKAATSSRSSSRSGSITWNAAADRIDASGSSTRSRRNESTS